MGFYLNTKMKQTFSSLLTGTLLVSFGIFAGNAFAQAPSESEDIMLQGFYWNSQKVTGWTQLAAQAEDIGQNFTLVWLPPSASAEGGGAVGGTNVGYHPRQWTNQTSCWGTAANLKSLITTLHANGVKVIADIVVNHRAGDTDWGNFTKDNFGTYGTYQLTAAHICKDDEMNTDKSSGTWYGKATGAADTGENWNGARDLDHTSSYVQSDIKAYLKWLKGEYGYDGWRYDYCKGFGGKYVGIYNDASNPYLSVGEYWDGSYDPVAAWIEATGKKSMAFDFPSKYDALNNGLAKHNYSKMSWIEDNTTWRPAGMIHHHNYNRYAVTFVDNHDTYRDSNKYTGDIAQAYAFILSSPGIPCVFYPHWTGSNKAAIEKQIGVRRAAGIHSESDVTVTKRNTYYESLAIGHKGTLITRIGTAAPSTVPDGYYLAAEGTGWKMYLSDNLAGVDNITADNPMNISISGQSLSVSVPSATDITVYSSDGKMLKNVHTATIHLTLPHGVYVVKAGKATERVTL